jgi:DNA-binding transcriptional LysR family regulator
VGPYGGAALVGPVVARLNQRHPRLRIRVVVAPWTELPARARSREVDVVVSELSEISEQADFESRALSIHRLFVVCRAGHPLTTLKTVTPQDLFKFPIAGPQLPGPAFERLQPIWLGSGTERRSTLLAQPQRRRGARAGPPPAAASAGSRR